ncbi:MspA family porin [Nocardia vulneris]|uniref:Porin n=1 Tax=Nocardia vulneris TaxID=1141657 RepID=A0ABR4Z9P3_9NOCA|nr:MspA family porin [Nocardia vulneris]KIA62022.1 porin [Nocardia vulneris]
MINRKNLMRRAGLGAAVTVAMGLCATGTADAGTFVALPGGELSKTLADGTVVTIELAGESVDIEPFMGLLPLPRNAAVSGRVRVELSGPPEGKAGSIFPGYTVGCEADVSGGAAGDLDAAAPRTAAVTDGTLVLGPGQVQSFYVRDLEQAGDLGTEVYTARNQFEGSSGSVSWTNENIALYGCSGPAQARAFVSLSVETDQLVTWITLWGQPFSLG